MPRGLTSMNQENEEREKNRGTKGQFIPYLRLKDDQESAKIRFLTDADSVYYDRFHNIKKKSSKGKDFWTNEVCPVTIGKVCPQCETAAESEDNSLWPRDQFMVWIYIYYIDHANSGKGREEIQLGTLTRYRQHVNGFGILMASTMHGGALTTAINRRGTLVDRDYEWIRSGPKGSNRPTYGLEAFDTAALAEDIVAKAALLPDLEDVAFRKVEKLTDELAGEGYKSVSVKDASFENKPQEGSQASPDEAKASESSGESNGSNGDIDPDDVAF